MRSFKDFQDHKKYEIVVTTSDTTIYQITTISYML